MAKLAYPEALLPLFAFPVTQYLCSCSDRGHAQLWLEGSAAHLAQALPGPGHGDFIPSPVIMDSKRILTVCEDDDQDVWRCASSVTGPGCAMPGDSSRPLEWLQ